MSGNEENLKEIAILFANKRRKEKNARTTGLVHNKSDTNEGRLFNGHKLEVNTQNNYSISYKRPRNKTR